MKRIALYYPWIYLTSGVERSILELVTHSRHKYTIFTNHFDPTHTYPEFQRLQVVQLRPISVKRDFFSVGLAAAVIATQKIDLSGYDLLMIHSDGLGDLIQVRNHHLPVICVCHTPLRISFDSHYLRQKPMAGLFGHIFKLIDRRLWQNYSAVAFNSRETYRRALAGKLVDKNQKHISIIHPGVHWRQIKPTGIFKHYFLLPGRIMWTKNIELGIQAFIQAKDAARIPPDFRLLVAGQVDIKSQPYLKKLRRLIRNRSDINFVTQPTDQQLSALYSHCWATLHCAFNEDWGLTCLEAGAHAKPVIAVNRGGPRESIINHKTGLLVPDTVTDFSRALADISHNQPLAKRLGLAGRTHVRQYDWTSYINQIDALIDSI